MKIVFYGADEICGGEQVKEPTFSVSLGGENRLITLHEVCADDESTLKDLPGYPEHAEEIWDILDAEIAAWDKGQRSPLEGGEVWLAFT